MVADRKPQAYPVTRALLACITGLLLLLAGCAGSALPPFHTAGGLTPCTATGDAFSAWQCTQFYAKQKINSYCLTVPGGEIGIRQCREFYAKLAEAPAPTSRTFASARTPPLAREVPLYTDQGVYVVSATINGSTSLPFVLDSGASGISLPASVAMELVHDGTLSGADYMGEGISTIADGSQYKHPIYRLRSVAVRGIIINDVLCLVGSDAAPPLWVKPSSAGWVPGRSTTAGMSSLLK